MPVDCARECGVVPCLACDTPMDTCPDSPAPLPDLYAYFYSNDGEQLFAYVCIRNGLPRPDEQSYVDLYLLEEGSASAPTRGVYKFYYSSYVLELDMSDCAGLATYPNATVPEIFPETYPDNPHAFCFGGSATADVSYYVVPTEEPVGSMLDVTYNGTKIIDSIEVTPPVTITYNGSIIATLNEGDTKTLDILGEDNKPKILSTPIVIGDNEIPDVDALGRKWVFEHNLEIEVGGGSN